MNLGRWLNKPYLRESRLSGKIRSHVVLSFAPNYLRDSGLLTRSTGPLRQVTSTGLILLEFKFLRFISAHFYI